MKKWKDYSVGFKIMFLSILTAFVFLGGVTYLIVLQANSVFADFANKTSRQDVDLIASNARVYVDNISRSVVFLSELTPIQGIIRATESGNNFDALEGSTLEQWKKRLEANLSSVLKSEKIYYRMRYIDETGKEFVRVDYKGKNLRVVEGSELRDLKERDYFLETMKNPFGKIYSSKIELDRLNHPPDIDEPHFPLMRYAVSLFDDKNVRKGIFIINVSFDDFLNQLGIGGIKNVFVIDQDGQYVFHEDENKKWGGDNNLATGENFKKDFPNNFKEVFLNDRGSFVVGDKIFFYSRANLNKDDPGKYIIFVKSISVSEALVFVHNFALRAFLSAGITFAALSIIFYLLAMGYFPSSKDVMVDEMKQDSQKESKGV